MSAIHQSPRTIENPIIKDKVVFLETAAESSGKFSLLQVELAPGGGNGLHYHKTFDETFTAIKGTLGVQVGRKVFFLKEGETATVPAGQLHRFFNPSDTEEIVFKVLIQPGSQGFEASLQVAYGLATDGLTNDKMVPKSLAHMALLVTWSDTNMPGVFSWIEPLFKWIARRAVKRGLDKELKERYCIL